MLGEPYAMAQGRPDHGPLMYLDSEPKFNLGSQYLLSFIRPTLLVIKSWTPPNATSRSQGTPPADSQSLQAQEIHSPKPNSPSNDSLHQLVWANWTIIHLTTRMCHENAWKKFVSLFFLLCSKKKRCHTPSYGNDFCSKGEAATKTKIGWEEVKNLVHSFGGCMGAFAKFMNSAFG